MQGPKQDRMNDNTGTQALWPQMIAALAAIDDALGIPQDGCNSTARTIAAIHELKQAVQSAEENAYQRSKKPLTESQIDEIANDGNRNVAGGIYATSVYEFARGVERAHGIGALTPNLNSTTP